MVGGAGLEARCLRKASSSPKTTAIALINNIIIDIQGAELVSNRVHTLVNETPFTERQRFGDSYLIHEHLMLENRSG